MTAPPCTILRRTVLKMLAGAAVSAGRPALASETGQSRNSAFTDVTAAAGIGWRHFNGESPDRFLVETMGGGVAFFDFDNDGFQDLFFVNGGETPGAKSLYPLRNALYRNLGNGRFEDVAERSGVAAMPFYGMGAAAADYDNDGFQDLLVTGYPRSSLFHNNGDGTFTDVTVSAGVLNSGKWGASAVWFDYDRDGFLDLFICNYVKFSFEEQKRCEMAGRRGYCEQVAYQGDSPTLYHNNGDGTFTDVTARAGLQELAGRALGAVAIDVDNDGWADLFVARDASPNLLLINKRNGTFEDVGLEAGVAYSESGNARAGMGVDAADINADGIPDFVVTNFSDEYHALFVSGAPLQYEDRGRQYGLAAATRLDVGFGARFLDYDNDGNLDVMIVNGHVDELMEEARPDVRYLQLPLLLRNSGNASFHDVRHSAGSFFNTRQVARGLATGDFDNDGGVDVAVTRLNSSPVLLRNNVGKDKKWIGFQLEGTKSNRDAIGAKLILHSGKRELVRWVAGGASYLSSHDRRVVFGLSESPVASVSVEIRWPSGATQTEANLAVGRYHKIREVSDKTITRNEDTK